MKFFLLFILVCGLAFSQERMGKELNLSAEQKVKMKEYRAEMKACKEKTQMKILSILNDEQKIKFLQMKKERKTKKRSSINIKKVDVKN